MMSTTISVSPDIQVEAVHGELFSQVIHSGMESGVTVSAVAMEILHHGSV